MAIIFIDGFGKYGPPAASATLQLAPGPTLNFANAARGHWLASVAAGNNGEIFIGPPIAPPEAGSLCIIPSTNSGAHTAKKTLPNYANAIGGVRFVANRFAANPSPIIQFLDNDTVQASIAIDSSGHILVQSASGPTIATSSSAIAQGAAHFLEWNFQMLASATWSLYLDGNLLLSGSAANFHGSANNFYNIFSLQNYGAQGTAAQMQFGTLYIDDGTGTPLLTNPIVETSLMTGDSAVTFTPQAYTVGYWNPLGTTWVAPAANTLFLRKFTTPAAGVTLNSVACVPLVTNGAANFKSVLYSDSAGSPNALLATGAQVTGSVAGVPLVSAFGAGQVLAGATTYWIGFITDTSVIQSLSDDLLSGVSKANTYASGAPNPAGAVTTAQSSWMLWGNCNALASNFSEVSEQAPLGLWGDYSYVSSRVVNNEDLYNVAALAGAPLTVYAVQVSGFMKNSAAGTRSLTLNTKSGAFDSPGSLAAAVPNNAVYQWFSSVWLADPNTSAAWTAANLNAAKAGYMITV
jgi:hypothetical protein